MLVITRKAGESVLIGDNIEVTVVRIDDGSIKLAIKAPREIPILRKELYTQVKKENKNAAIWDSSVIKKLETKK